MQQRSTKGIVWTTAMKEDNTPISPGSSLSNMPDHTLPSQMLSGPPPRESRADLVLILGILSLIMCGPMGIIAWIIANSEQKGIRAGTVSSKKMRVLKVGRALGIFGVILFVAEIFALSYVVQRYADNFVTAFTSEPLKAQELAFVGEWHGSNGTFIRISPDGRGDFVSKNSRLRGGRVKISGDQLSIGIMGIAKTWHLDRPPYQEDGQWTMQLDGETFKRKSDDLMVQCNLSTNPYSNLKKSATRG
jgi:hypothetical protein